MIGFWIYMLIVDMIIPFTMIGFGGYFIKQAPKEINYVFGYRTTISMKNRDTWEFAHSLCGRLWRTAGWGMFVISLIAMIFVFGKEISTVGNFSGIICIIQLVIMLASIIPVEILLNKNFDRNGFRRK